MRHGENFNEYPVWLGMSEGIDRRSGIQSGPVRSGPLADPDLLLIYAPLAGQERCDGCEEPECCDAETRDG